MDITKEVLDTIRAMYDNKNLSHLMDFCQGEMRTLNYLFVHESNQVIPSEISDELNVSRSRTTSTLATLREKGMITMDISKNDRRKMLVTLTAKGKGYIAKRQQEAEAFVEGFINKIGEQNAEQLVTLLKLISQFGF